MLVALKEQVEGVRISTLNPLDQLSVSINGQFASCMSADWGLRPIKTNANVVFYVRDTTSIRNRIMTNHNHRTDVDVLVIGAGAAGLSAALRLASTFKVLVLSKESIRSSSTNRGSRWCCGGNPSR